MITINPSDKKVLHGNSATFSMEVFGDGLTYQWQKNNMSLQPNGGKFEGVDTMTLTVNDVQSEDAGIYSCVVTQSDGGTESSVTSNEVTLTVGKLLHTMQYYS